MINTPKLLTVSQMARRLRVRVGWLRTEAEAKRIPHLEAEPGPLFDPDAVEAALAERARSEGYEPGGADA